MKIGDLGLARTYESLAKTEHIRGTPCYMSPEFFLHDNKSKIDFKADIWSFGCVLYEMITLEKAFYDIDIYKLIEKIKNAKYTIPNDVNHEYKEILEK